MSCSLCIAVHGWTDHGIRHAKCASLFMVSMSSVQVSRGQAHGRQSSQALKTPVFRFFIIVVLFGGFSSVFGFFTGAGTSSACALLMGKNAAAPTLQK